MKKVFEDILASNDMQAIKNCVTIMADCCEVGMNDSVMLDMMKQIKGEIGACHYNEDMADMHLCLIGQLHTKDVAKDYWHEVKNDNIQSRRLVRSLGRNGKDVTTTKLKEIGYPKINTYNYEQKYFR